MDAWPVVFGDFRLRLARGGGNTEQLSRLGDVLGTIAVGEQAVITNAVEALGKDVDQEAADELARRDRHGLEARCAVGAIVLVVERDFNT